MKTKSISILSLSLAAAVFNFSIQAAEVKTNKQTKITEAAAEKAALEQFPGGKVKSAKLEHMHGSLVYLIGVSLPKSNKIATFRVDATTGKAMPSTSGSKLHTLKRSAKPAVASPEKKETVTKAPQKSETPVAAKSTPVTSGSAAVPETK